MLFLTDNLELSNKIKHLLDEIEECTVVHGVSDILDTKYHSVIICDMKFNSLNGLSAKLFIDKHRSSMNVPLLYLSHRSHSASLVLAREIGANVVMENHASIEQILFFVRRLVESRKPVFDSPVPPASSVVAIHVDYAATIYKQAVEAVRHGKLIDSLDLERGSDAIIAAVGGQRMSAWLDVVRSYDEVTHQHCLLVACFAVLFSREQGLLIKNQRMVGKAALIHDIGKLSIPLAILNKPGKLTEVEMDVIKTHPSIGYQLLKRQGGFDVNTLDMVLHHHEYLDGSGYPDGLHEEKISHFCRIMTICDIYSALIERRSYKEPMSSVDALKILKNMGPKIDQSVVENFGRMIENS